MIRVEIKSSEIRTKSGTSARTGKPYTIREQEGWAFTFDRNSNPNPYPQKLAISLGVDQQPYAPGNYELSPASFYLNRFNQLEVSPVLRPLAAVASSKSAA